MKNMNNIKIIYGEHFDNENRAHLFDDQKKESEAIYNIFLMGPLGLLRFLEQRLGYGGVQSQTFLRKEQYRQVLLENKKGNFFERSLGVDEDSVTNSLLMTRDELIQNGFDLNQSYQSYNDAPERIKQLCAIEKGLTIECGFADRWDFIIRNIEKLPFSLTIELAIPEDLLTPYEKRMIAGLKTVGVQIMEPQKEETTSKNSQKESDLDKIKNALLSTNNKTDNKKVTLEGDKSFVLLLDPDIITLTRSVSKIVTHSHKFLVENGGNELALGLKHEGIPSIGETIACEMNPTLQLFKVISELLWDPIDSRMVTQFLNLKIKPIPKDLGHKLLEVFCEFPGFGGEDWNNAIKEWMDKNNDSEQKEKGEKALKNLFDRVRYDTDLGAPIDAVIELHTYMTEYLNKLIHIKDFKTGLQEEMLFRVINASKQLIQILNLRKKTDNKISKLKLDRLLDDLSPVSDISNIEEERNRPDVFMNPEIIRNPIDNLCWFDFSGTDFQKINFWTIEETKWLKNRGVVFDTSNSIFERRRWATVNMISLIKEQLIIAMPSTRYGEKTIYHPFYSDLVARINNLEDVTNISLKNISKTDDLIVLPKITDEWKVTHTALLTPRDVESYSSLEKLFFYPFIWVLNYKAHIKPAPTSNLPDDTMLSGRLNHKMLEMFLTQHKDLAIIEVNDIARWHDKNFDHLLQTQGATLLEKSKKSNKYTALKTHSLRTLIDIRRHIVENGWEIANSECELYTTFSGTKIKGILDVLLQKGRGKKREMAIIDLKKGGHPSRYKQVIEDEDIQLVLYSKLAATIDNHTNFVPASFYIAETGKLISKDRTAFKNSDICASEEEKYYLDSYKKIWNQMEKTFTCRMNELKEGVIKVQMDEMSAAKAKEHPYDGIDTLKLNAKEPYGNNYKTLRGEDE